MGALPQRRPGAVPFGGAHAGVDEQHAFQAVVHGRVDHFRRRRRTRPGGADRRRRFAVDVGETLQVAFRVARRNAGETARRVVRARTAAGDQAFRFAERREAEMIGMLLFPLQAALGTVDAQLQDRKSTR